MKRLWAMAAAVVVTVGLVAAAPAGATTAGQGLTWTSCKSTRFPKLECATLQVPLDYSRPHGPRITLALSRMKATSPQRLGALLVNPGGPGGSGLGLAGFVASALPKDVASRYDIIGFDPRGVGRSVPALTCDPHYFDPVRPDYVPRSRGEEVAWRIKADRYAAACAKKYAAVLPYMNTISAAKDMDAIRVALHQSKISYFGYSYGTYLGAVYGQLFPNRVRRLVLDSIVRVSGVWYDDNIDQDYAFDARHKAFLAWVAKYDTTYHLGADPAVVEKEWYAMRDELRRHPAGGKVGPSELDDTYTPGGYFNGYWPTLAQAFSDYVVGHKPASLVKAYTDLGAQNEGEFAVYNAVQCRDAPWPRDWSVWHADTVRVYRKAPFLAWSNTWYNAACATWRVPSGRPVQITGRGLPPVLLFQATNDAATPYPGGVEMHRRLRSSRLVVEVGGGNHGITLSGNTCLDGYLARYLRDGALPPANPAGPADATCPKLPDPTPTAATTSQSQTGQGLHGYVKW